MTGDQPPLPSRQLIELLSRALIDMELCNRLFVEPDAIAKTFGLSPDEAEAIKRLDRRTFEQKVMQIRSA
jgi:hypothetical protein